MPTSISTRTPGSLNPTRQQLDELDALLQRMLELPVNQTEEKNEAEAEEADEMPPPPVVRPTATKPPPYTVVETASPRPLPAASGFAPRPSPETVAEERPQPPIADADTPASEAEMWVPLRSTWQPSAQTWQPLAESWRQANDPAAPPVVVSSPIPIPQIDPPPEIAPSPAPAPVESVQDIAPAAESAPVADAPVEPRLSLTAEDAPVEPRLLLPLLWFNQGFDACMAPLGVAGQWLCSPSGRQTLGLAGLACLAAAVVVAVSAGMSWPW
ncbi:MAG TPA: hypothetical protein VH575_06540 [Gemmataceae bacterium]|jgi:hypothetical protein